MVLRYRASEGEGEDGGAAVIPPKPRQLKPLDSGEAPGSPQAEDATRRPSTPLDGEARRPSDGQRRRPSEGQDGRPSSGQGERRPPGAGAEDGPILQPRPPAEPRTPNGPRGSNGSDKVSPKVRQIKKQIDEQGQARTNIEGEDSTDNNSGASTVDTPHAEAPAVELGFTDIAKAERNAGEQRLTAMSHHRRSSARKSMNSCILTGEPWPLASSREYLEHLYRQAEQALMWRELDEHAADHLHTETEEPDGEVPLDDDDDEPHKNVRLNQHVEIDLLGDDNDDEDAPEGERPEVSGGGVVSTQSCPANAMKGKNQLSPEILAEKKAQAVRRQSAFILQFAATPGRAASKESAIPEGDGEEGDGPAEATMPSEGGASGGGEAPETERPQPKPKAKKKKPEEGEPNPLKPALTAKKINHKTVRELLEKTADLSHWLEAPLCIVGPPPIPKALVVAVSANDQKLVELLLEFKADVVSPYAGPGIYKGWVKPDVSLLHSVHNRKGRFVGTMLADRLEDMEKVLMAAQAEQGNRVEEEVEDEEEPVQTRDSAVGASGNTRVSVKLQTAKGGFTFTHTQGHPRDVYEIHGLLGDGDTSTCWEGWHSVSRVPVAIKAECKSDEVMIWEEINIMRRFGDHPNIVRLEETFETAKQVFMVLELCEGGRLFDSLSDKSGTVKHTARSARLMGHLAAAIRHLHSKTICHRDIQLENFLLFDGAPLQKAVVKLIDFTTAKEFGPGQPQMKTKICTPSYVAREILSRKQTAYTEKVDIWSLGVVYYIILCGSAPFVGETDFEVLKKVKSGKYKFEPAEIWDTVPEQAIDLVSKMIVSKPEERLSADGVMEHPWLKSADC